MLQVLTLTDAFLNKTPPNLVYQVFYVFVDKKSSCDDEELTNISADQGDNLSCQSNEELSSPSTHPEVRKLKRH